MSLPQMMPNSWTMILFTCIIIMILFISLWNLITEMSQMVKNKQTKSTKMTNSSLW